MSEHGQADKAADSGRGVHPIQRFPDVADSAALLALGATQIAFDRGGVVYQTDIKKYWIADGVGGWRPLIEDSNLRSGVLTGGLITNGAGAGQVSVTDGSGRIVGYSTPADPILNENDWSGQTDVAIDDIATTQITFLLEDLAGTLVQISGALPSETQLRGNVFLGWVTHPDNVNIDDIIAQPRLAYGAAQDFSLFSSQFSPLIASGLEVLGVVGTASIQHTSGQLFAEGNNFHTNPNVPSLRTVPAQNPITFDRIFSDGAEGGETQFNGEDVTVLDPDNFDSAGTLTSVGGASTRATIQRFYVSPTGNVFMAYGQEVYSTLNDAIADAGKEAFVESAGMQFGTLVGRWVVTRVVTDTTSLVQARFLPAPSGGGGGGITGSTITDFLGLTDTPNSYVGQGLKRIRVNEGESALEFVEIGVDEVYAAAEVEQTTTATSIQSALQITKPASMPAGTYEILWDYTWRYGATNNDFIAEIRQDGLAGALLWTHVEEPSENAADRRMPASGRTRVALDAAAHTFDVGFFSGGGANTAGISQLHFSLKRVGP